MSSRSDWVGKRVRKLLSVCTPPLPGCQLVCPWEPKLPVQCRGQETTSACGGRQVLGVQWLLEGWVSQRGAGRSGRRGDTEGRTRRKSATEGGGTRGRAGVCALCVSSPNVGILVGTLQAAMPGSHRHPPLKTTGHVLKEGPALQNRRGSLGAVVQWPLQRPLATEVWPELGRGRGRAAGAQSSQVSGSWSTRQTGGD